MGLAELISTTRDQFHQHAYMQLLLTQILKAQKAARLDCLFCTFGTWVCKSCSKNAGERQHYIGGNLDRRNLEK